ncbi:MAG: HEAT repeat domain-containing protein [Planctomycetes bacterium]|nr:HEAT repeat domain-containing protein [Planctomycetota bacterium]
MKAEAAVPALVQALKDADLGVASTAAASLGKVGVHSPDAVKGLLGALTGGRQDLKPTCAEALGRIGPNAGAAAPALVEALGSDDFDLRREAATALGFLGPRAEAVAPPRLKGLLTDAEPRVRVAAATSLARLGDRSPELADVLGGAVQKSNRLPLEVRHAAAEALGLLGPHGAKAVPTLLAALREAAEINPALPYAEQRQAQHDDFRRAVAGALGRIGDESAIPALRTAAENDALREAATEALGKLGAE